MKTYPSEENTKEHKLGAVKCRATKRNSTVDFRKETLPGHKLPMHILHVSSKILSLCVWWCLVLTGVSAAQGGWAVPKGLFVIGSSFTGEPWFAPARRAVCCREQVRGYRGCPGSPQWGVSCSPRASHLLPRSDCPASPSNVLCPSLCSGGTSGWKFSEEDDSHLWEEIVQKPGAADQVSWQPREVRLCSAPLSYSFFQSWINFLCIQAFSVTQGLCNSTYCHVVLNCIWD